MNVWTELLHDTKFWTKTFFWGFGELTFFIGSYCSNVKKLVELIIENCSSLNANVNIGFLFINYMLVKASTCKIGVVALS